MLEQAGTDPLDEAEQRFLGTPAWILLLAPHSHRARLRVPKEGFARELSHARLCWGPCAVPARRSSCSKLSRAGEQSRAE